VFDQPLLNNSEVSSHGFLGSFWIALADCRSDLTVRGRVSSLIVDAVSSLASVTPRTIRRDMQQRLENSEEDGIACRGRDTPMRSG